MKKQALTFSSDPENRQKALFEIENETLSINYGTVILKKGIRIPETGFTQHPQHEISYLVEGKIQTLNPDGTNGEILTTGDAVYIEALEAQAGIVLEDTKIIYVLIGTKNENEKNK